MEDYVEDYKYNNCFWKKSGVLYNHAESKFREYMSVGEMFQSIGKALSTFCSNLDSVPNIYKQSDSTSTRGKGISVIINCIKLLNNESRKLLKEINTIAAKIVEKKLSYDSKKDAIKMCDDYYKKYQGELNKLSSLKKVYFDTTNKAIESCLNIKYSNKSNKKNKEELNNKKKQIIQKKEDYKNQIDEVEKSRVEYMEVQGNIFASEEELERECTDELKGYFTTFFNAINNFSNNLIISQDNYQIIEAISGDHDNKSFAEKNKSLMTGPKRNLYKEYSQDLNYYVEHFDILKSRLKGKSSKEIRDIHKEITQEVTLFLGDIIKEESDAINQRVEQIAKDLKENKLSPNDFQYLIEQFQKRFEEFKRWKREKVADQDYRKVGKEWDERFCYMHTFLGYFNKTRVENKELNKSNFEYLVKAIQKILELNENEDIDYNLCDLVVILSSTFYMADPNAKNGKRYITDVIKKCSIIQKQGFWVGLTRFELNEEIQQQNKIEDTLKEDDISEAKLNNSVVAKLMSVSYNIINFVMDTKLFNRIIYDIFKYCKINAENREIVVDMIEGQIQSENLNHLVLDKEFLTKSNFDGESEEVSQTQTQTPQNSNTIN